MRAKECAINNLFKDVLSCALARVITAYKGSQILWVWLFPFKVHRAERYSTRQTYTYPHRNPFVTLAGTPPSRLPL